MKYELNVQPSQVLLVSFRFPDIGYNCGYQVIFEDCQETRNLLTALDVALKAEGDDEQVIRDRIKSLFNSMEKFSLGRVGFDARY